ncbi:hypothetical protein TDB9533_03521 [Thalassocella blandensis]|nr:hypothetical protein TDB9533_03521 [Thalassocella blandensis]
MPTTRRRKSLSLVEQIKENPKRFSFFQLVRLLERAAFYAGDKNLIRLGQSKQTYMSSNAVARYSPPTKEAIRFYTPQHLSFPDAEVSSVSQVHVGDELEQWRVAINFMGLTGPMGVLPFHYTETILKRLKEKDYSLAHFFDLFNHRTVSLFFQASTKYRLPLDYERANLHKFDKQGVSNHTHMLLSVLGLGTGHLSNRSFIRDESFLFFSGLLSQQVKSASGLKQIIEHYFDVPIQIEGFIGQWQELIDDVRSRLGCKFNRKGQNVCLGKSAMLGRKGWFTQGKSRIKVGPLNKEQFYKFAPGTTALKSLNEMVQCYMGMEQDFDFVIQVKRENVPDKIALGRGNPPIMGWNTWLSGKPRTNTDKDTLLQIGVSSKKLK